MFVWKVAFIFLSLIFIIQMYLAMAVIALVSGGVDYERVGDTLRVVIGRCAVGAPCEPMAKSVIPLDDSWQAEVHLPYDGSRVVVVHSDGEKQVYP